MGLVSLVGGLDRLVGLRWLGCRDLVCMLGCHSRLYETGSFSYLMYAFLWNPVVSLRSLFQKYWLRKSTKVTARIEFLCVCGSTIDICNMHMLNRN